MNTDPPSKSDTPLDPISRLEALCAFSGSPEAFWETALKALCQLVNAECGIFLLRGSAAGEGWRVVRAEPDPRHGEKLPPQFSDALPAAAETTVETGTTLQRLDGGGGRHHFLLGMRLHLNNAAEHCVALFLSRRLDQAAAEACLRNLRLAGAMPACYDLRRSLERTVRHVERMGIALDIMVQLNDRQHFIASCMTLCNELAGRLQCDRVSLGWLQRGYVRLQTISHTEKFDRKMDAVQHLEQTMEEAVCQDDEVIWPAPAETMAINRDHERYARTHAVDSLCSVPLRLDAEPIACLTCERNTTAFSEDDAMLLRLCADQVCRRLADLKRHDRWIGARLAMGLGDCLGKLVGVQHTWAKVVALLLAAALAILVFYRAPYRVEGTFLLRSSELTHVPAPFEGYIEAVHVQVGDVVEAGAALVELDTEELLLEKSATEAERNRRLREVEKARADNELAAMRVALAAVDQAEAKLAILNNRLAQATIRAPFSGVVVRGDFEEALKERVGAPVRKGDVLLKVATLDNLVAETKIDERDIDHIRPDADGQIAFASQPDLTFPVALTRIEPVALPGEAQNMFTLHFALTDPPAPWFRPGMGGVCKTNAGKRTLLWIFTHRTVDFLRLLLWW